MLPKCHSERSEESGLDPFNATQDPPRLWLLRMTGPMGFSTTCSARHMPPLSAAPHRRRLFAIMYLEQKGVSGFKQKCLKTVSNSN